MTTGDSGREVDEAAEARLEKLQANLARIEALNARLVAALSNRKPHDPALDGPSQEVYMKAAAAWLAGMMQNPTKVIEHQVNYWGKTLQNYVAAQQAMLKGEKPEPVVPDGDKRFANPLWDENPAFAYLKQQYLLNAQAVADAVGDMEDIDPVERKRVEYFTRQIVDMMAPTNFLGLNPDALERALETDGESLVKGLENLVADVEAGGGNLQVRLADPKAFTLGQNIAATPGGVVFRNRMFELIQYVPTTEKVHKKPLLIFPPWINKFYVLDMTPENSLIRWLVGQGFSVFVVSWVNPDASYAETTLDDYLRDGFLTAMAEVRRITGEKRINAVGYCIAGTMLGLALAHLERAGDKSINAATFFTTLTDFSDPGEVGVFLADDFVDGIARQAAADGVLRKTFMARTFSFLRSNDLIYRPAIKSYMMGEAPPAFDLLYWNGDGTNLPAKMTLEYLQGLCREDGFAKGTFPVFGKPVDLSGVKVPLCAVACETDHIAAWKASFNGIRQMGSKDKSFILSQSGHIAGIVNPPSKEKYGHYISETKLTEKMTPEEWLDGATYRKGSWWPDWGAWLAKRSGPMVPARPLGDSAHPVLAPAPGTYVSMVPAD